MGAEFELTYRGASIEEYIGEYPNLDIHVNVRITSKDEETKYVYIPQLNFGVDLFSADSLRGGFGRIGSFGVFHSEPLFFDRDASLVISIPINTKKFEEMQKIRAAEKMVSFYISAEGKYSSYTDAKQYSMFYPISTKAVMKNMPDGSKSGHIILTTEEFIEISRDIKHFEIYRLEIPISKIETSAQRDLQRAMDLMMSAKNNLIQNNYQGALLDIRNAVSNHILKRREDKNALILKEEIKDYVLQKVPSDVKDVYKDVLNNITSLLNSSLQNLHKFVHKDSDKLKLSPMPQDIETIYFTTVHLIRYLTSYG